MVTLLLRMRGVQHVIINVKKQLFYKLFDKIGYLMTAKIKDKLFFKLIDALIVNFGTKVA